MTLPNRINYKSGSMRRDRSQREDDNAEDVCSDDMSLSGPVEKEDDDTEIDFQLHQILSFVLDEEEDLEESGGCLPTMELQAAAQEARDDVIHEQAHGDFNSLDRSLIWSFSHCNLLAEEPDLISLEALKQTFKAEKDGADSPNETSQSLSDDSSARSMLSDALKSQPGLVGSMERYQQQYEGEAFNKFEQVLHMINDQSVTLRYRHAIRDLHQLARAVSLRHTDSTGSPWDDLSSSALGILEGHAWSSASANAPTSPSMDCGRGCKKRTNLSKTAKQVLQQWFEEHLHHPYPTEEEKDMLAMQGGITIEQVNNWFINTRGRKWKPMLMRLVAQKEAGVECKLLDQMRERLEEPYRRSPS
uniref:Uncharacterized protein AlNc14C172G8035 n=1 Tax=Albugo laibachii Nc14 TaxID=890382 RepID=F0WNL2_9STRA|nr:conserved hypothetical protein [Albugo laibachii Nc14]|eukprot:CCA22903.1 conserved hypothetical protein [Albugo laibachii Nc14]